MASIPSTDPAPTTFSTLPAENGGYVLVGIQAGVGAPAYVRITDQAGGTIDVPLAALTGSAEVIALITKTMTAQNQNAKRAYAGKARTYGLVSKKTGKTFAPPRGNPGTPGTPILVWVDNPTQHAVNGQATGSGWGLYLAEAQIPRLGFACWDDLDGIRNLANLANNPETLYAMAALTHPKQMTLLTAIMTAATLIDHPNLPEHPLTALEQLLLQPGIGSEPSTGWNTEIAHLTIEGPRDERVVVGAGIKAPFTKVDAFLWDREHGTTNLSAVQRWNATVDRVDAETATWRKNAETVLAADGWRLVDLSQVNPNGYRDTAVMWVTRLDEDMWQSILPVARQRSHIALWRTPKRRILSWDL